MNETMEFLIQYGPYIGVYLFTEAIKNAFKIPRRWIPIVPFVLGWLIAAAMLVIKDSELPVKVFAAKVLLEGLIVGALSIAIRNIYTKVILNKG
jgi:hypothetical protein